jgi:serine/threonine-protein kinase
MAVSSVPIHLPNYHILDKLGTGAESRVYRARCVRTGKLYAVKIVRLTRPDDMSFVELLKVEREIGATIHHPVLRRVFDLRMIRYRLRLQGAVLFLEFVEGIPMSDKEFRRPMDEVLSYFEQAASGLHAMHQAGFVHADLKPNNILVGRDGHVKLIDFGQSTRIRTAKSRVQGTIDYIAPEQVQKGILDQRTDVFGLGAAMYRVLTGRAVQTEMNQTVTVHSQSLVGKRLADLRVSALGELPACVAKLIEDCCRYRPEERIPDMPTLTERIRFARHILARPAEATEEFPDLDEETHDNEPELRPDGDFALSEDLPELTNGDLHAMNLGESPSSR